MSNNENQELLATTEAGLPPKRRLSTPAAAFALFEDLVTKAAERARQWARIKGMYDRNPPDDPAKLAADGRAYQTNVNTGEMESIVDTNASAAHEAVFEVHTLITGKVRAEYVPEGINRPYADIIAEEYTELMLNWDGFFPNADLTMKESFLYGIGGQLWRDEWDWRPRAYQSASFLFPPKASLDLEELELFMVRDELPARWIYEEIENEEVAKAAGWDVAYTRRALVNTYHLKGGDPNDEHQTSSWESTQQKIRNNDSEAERADFGGVPVVHILVREVYSGKVTHLIIPEGMTEQGFLYEAPDRFESMSQVLWILPFDNGDKLIRSVKGTGHRAFMHCDLSNRLFGNTIDGGAFSAALMVQPRSGSDLSKLQVAKIGGMVVIPPELNVIQQSFTPQIQHLINLRSMSSELLNNNLGVFRPRSENPISRDGEKTAEQVRSEDAKEARFNKSQSTLRYYAWDRWHREVFRRLTRHEYLSNGYDSIDALVGLMLEATTFDEVLGVKSDSVECYPGQELAMEFVFNCLKRDVLPEILLVPRAFRFKATRSIGLGSESGKNQALESLMAQRGSMDEVSRLNVQREWAAAKIGGFHNVDRFFPLRDSADVPGSETVIAMLENHDMEEGKALPVGSDQFHAVHAPTHLSYLFDTIGRLQQDPASTPIPVIVRLFELEIPHIQKHLQALAGDRTRKQQLQGYLEALKQLIEIYRKLKTSADRMAKQQQQAQEAQAGQIAELQQKADENQMELEVRKHRVDQEMDIERSKTENLNQTRIAKMETSIQANLQSTMASMFNEQLKTQVKIALDQALAAAKISEMKNKGES